MNTREASILIRWRGSAKGRPTEPLWFFAVPGHQCQVVDREVELL